QRARFGESGEILHQSAPLDADIVERRGEDDCDCGYVVDIAAVRLESRIVTKYAQQIFRESRGNRAQRRSTNDDELGPAEEEGRKSPPRLPDEDINAAGTREGARHLRQSQRAAKNE